MTHVWRDIPLRFLGRITSGATPTPDPVNWDGEIVWITPDDLGRMSGREITDSARRLSPVGIASCASEIVPVGSVILSTRAPIGHVGIARTPLCFNQGCRAISPRLGYSSEFLFYALLASRERLESLGAGTTFKELSRDRLVGLKVKVPLPQEQTRIVKFLDRETAKIDTLIAKQTEFLTRLDEHRRAVVTQTVTRGLDSSVPQKKTGRNLVPTIPAHWAVKRLKHLSAEVTVGVVVTPSKYYADQGVPALRSLNVQPMVIIRENLVFFDEHSNRVLAKSMIRAGDLVAVRTGKPGTTAVVPDDLDGANCIDLILIRRASKFDSRFLAYVMNSDLAHMQYAEGSEGAIQQHFNIETAKNLVLPVPPVPEQSAIVEHLDARLGKLDATRERSIRMIETLRERRAALIAAAVTGQINVTQPTLTEAAD